MEQLQRGMQAQSTSGTIPELVRLLQRAALATEEEGRPDLAASLRWWADHLANRAGEGEAPCQSELWLG